MQRAAKWSNMLVASCGLCLLSGFVRGADDGAGVTYFEKEVRPILVERCYACHSHGEKIKGGLVLDSRSGWQSGGDSGPALVPGKPEASLLIKAIGYADSQLQMPPKKKLGEAEIAVLKEWVKRGAPDPRESMTVRQRAVSIEAARKHWSFQPIRKPAAVQAAQGIDGFIAAKLAANRLVPAPQTDRYTWLRRVSFDLTGLPPTPQQIDAFIHDQAPDARDKVVDRLLASPAFGERWARHWLDLVGYADQIGSANNVPAIHAWRYRDYVIRAFNAGKPFDEFIREQIAGDLLPATSVAQRQDQLTGTGFLVLGNINIVEADKDKLRVDIVDQQIEKVGKTFLGMTLQCARCHDHKFDPVSQREYYGLAGIFTSIESVYLTGRGVWSSVPFGELPLAERDRRQLAARQKAHEMVVAQVQGELAKAKTPGGASPDEKAKADKLARDLENQLRHLEFIQPAAPQAYEVRETAAPGDTRITIRGNPHALGETVPRGFVAIASRGRPPSVPRDQSGRIQLAEWLTGPDNVLTSRVLVNRIWQKLFGEGLVRSVDYFGLRGEQPSHPELLDYLAWRFMHDGWSSKRLIREIVLSATYGRDSRGLSDPENRLLARQNTVRLDAEAIRDATLAISGDLVAGSDGPSLALEFRDNVSGLDPKNVNPVAFSLSKFRPGQAWQRTVYLPIVRSSAQKGPAEILDFFDFAQPAQFLGQRPVTTVPPQALFLMNSPLFKTQAARLAAALIRLEDEPLRLAKLYLRVLNRPITPEETAEAHSFLAQSSSADAWTSLCHALLTCNEFLFRL